MSATNPPPEGPRRRRSSPKHARRGGLPRWIKVILLVVVIAVAIVVLFTTVFPWVEERMQDPTMGVMMARLGTLGI